MDLHQLRTFVAVAREGNITRASATLCRTAPGISTQIKALEQELGVTLFDRAPRGMHLTPVGIQLLQRAEDALSAAKNFLDSAKSLHATVSGEFRMATISEPTAIRIGELLANMVTNYPGIRFKLSQEISGRVLRQLMNDEIDGGFIVGTASEPEIETIRLASLALCIAGPANWRTRLEAAAWTDLSDFPWIGMPAECAYNHIATMAFARDGQRLPQVVETDQEWTLIDLISKGVGLALIRVDQARRAEEAGQIAVWPRGRFHTFLHFAFLRRNRLNPLLTAVLEEVNAVWKENLHGIATNLPGEKIGEAVYLELEEGLAIK